jgi:hypothetical protein
MRAFRNLGDAELIPLSDVDGGWLAGQIEDWAILVRLHQLGFDGLVTGDDSMIELPKELAVLTQLKMLLLVLARSNRNMVETTGLLLVHIRRVLQQRDPSRAQLFVLHPPAGNRPEDDLSARFKARARHYRKKNTEAYLAELRVSDAHLGKSVQEWYPGLVAVRQPGS